MSKRENRKAYHKAREKEYYALNKKRDEKWRESITYDYEELDNPIHIGYVKYFVVTPSLVGSKIEPHIQEIIDNCQVEVFSKRKDFRYGKRKHGFKVYEPYFRYNQNKFDNMTDKAKSLVSYSYEKAYGWQYWYDFRIMFLNPSMVEVKTKKDYVYYRRLLNTESISEYRLVRDKLSHDFIAYGNENYRSDTWYHRYVNRTKRHNINQTLRKIKTTDDEDIDFLEFNYNKSPDDYYW